MESAVMPQCQERGDALPRQFRIFHHALEDVDIDSKWIQHV